LKKKPIQITAESCLHATGGIASIHVFDKAQPNENDNNILV